MGNLDKLLYWRGVGHDYINYRGETVVVSIENRLRLLHAMGVETEPSASVNEQVFELDIAPWQQWLAELVMVDLSEDRAFDVNLKPEDLGKTFDYVVTLEEGGEHNGKFKPSELAEVGDYLHNGTRYSRRSVPLGDLPLGYHTIKVSTSALVNGAVKEQSSPLVVVPAKAYEPSWVSEGRRPWGIIIQLYTLRSHRNWGIGDFSDLTYLIREASKAGADMVGLNPLHALRSPIEFNCSPYSPSDRRFINPMYIDPELEPEFTPNEELLAALPRLRASAKVDYAGVERLKMLAFKEMFERFEALDSAGDSHRSQQFSAFVELCGQPLRDFCLYQVLNEIGQGQVEQFSDEERAEISEKHSQRIRFHAYLQWLANEQLEKCQTFATECGMNVGLMRDLAVGADGGGSEVSTNLELFCRGAAVGAPPDPLAEIGQNWGLPPMDPTALRNTNFEHYVNLLKANMSHCGALRIDHAMGLMRLWWCPPGKTADFGAYVYYPFREMLGFLKLESVRNQCMVIGEDMGIVPHGFREALIDASIFTNKMFYFEKQPCGYFTAPQDYFERSLSMLTNHDVPTIASWWVASDLELRRDLNLFEEGADFTDVYNTRQQEKHKMLEWLANLNLVPRDRFEYYLAQDMTQELASKILHGVSHCASQLFVIQLEDLELIDAPVNVPGTSDQYANWQRKLEVPLEDLFKDSCVQDLMADIKSERT